MLCIDWFAPGYKAGGPISSCVNFVKGLEDVFDIYVLTTDTDLGEPHPYPNIQANQWLPFGQAASVFYLSKHRLSLGNIKKQIDNVAPDFLYLNSLFSVYFTLIPLILYKFNQINPILVLAPRGMLRESALRFKSYKKKVFLSIAKIMGLYKSVHFHATDEQEVMDIKRHLPQVKRIKMIPNLSKSITPLLKDIGKQPQQLRCVFIGRIHPIKNLLFLLELLKQVRHFQLEMTIIGNLEDEAYWQECHTVIAQLPPLVSVQYVGSVSAESIESYLLAHHFMILPTRGENFGHAIFEAFLAGRPVIISDQTPWRNLAVQQAGFDLPLDSPAAWIEALQTVAAMPQEIYNHWSNGALQFAQQYVAKSETKAKYIELFS